MATSKATTKTDGERDRGVPTTMKTMTCNQLGGACDHAHSAATADEVIKLQDKHLRDAVAGGDDTHQPALDAMKGRWKHPVKSMGWYKNVKREFAAIPTTG